MSENREYVSRSDELGNIHISGEVLASIAAAAALEVEGVSGLSANLGSDIAELLSNKKNLTKGVHIQVEDEQVTVELGGADVLWTHHPRGGTGRAGRGEEQRGVHDRRRWPQSTWAWAGSPWRKRSSRPADLCGRS